MERCTMYLYFVCVMYVHIYPYKTGPKIYFQYSSNALEKLLLCYIRNDYGW